MLVQGKPAAGVGCWLCGRLCRLLSAACRLEAAELLPGFAVAAAAGAALATAIDRRFIVFYALRQEVSQCPQHAGGRNLGGDGPAGEVPFICRPHTTQERSHSTGVLQVLGLLSCCCRAARWWAAASWARVCSAPLLSFVGLVLQGAQLQRLYACGLCSFVQHTTHVSARSS